MTAIDSHGVPTQKVIADSLGLPRGTVDRALHNRKGVNKTTKARVIKKVSELGYSPNLLAQFLVTGKTLNTDAPESKRLCFVGQDPILAGRIGGELMGKFLKGTDKVVIITAFKKVLVHRHPGITIEEVYENHDNEDEAYWQIKDFLSQSRKIDVGLRENIDLLVRRNTKVPNENN